MNKLVTLIILFNHVSAQFNFGSIFGGSSSSTSSPCDPDVNGDPGGCQNGATCSESLGIVSCSCATGFTGDKCENNIDECSSNPCQNNGVCKDVTNGYECTCPPGITGDQCETNTFCPSAVGISCVANGGDCSTGVCICPASGTAEIGNATYTYTPSGVDCSIQSFCIDTVDCGTGVCVESPTTEPPYYCDCDSTGFTGKNCEIALSDQCNGHGNRIVVNDTEICDCLPEFTSVDGSFQDCSAQNPCRDNTCDPDFSSSCEPVYENSALTGNYSCICQDDHWEVS